MLPFQNSTTPPVGAATPVATLIVAMNVTVVPKGTLAAVDDATDTVLAAEPVAKTVAWSSWALVALR